jgi:hypothetical protein
MLLDEINKRTDYDLGVSLGLTVAAENLASEFKTNGIGAANRASLDSPDLHLGPP